MHIHPAYTCNHIYESLMYIYLYVCVFGCVSTVDCVDPLCSGRGVCVRGECVCSAGWGGESCETALPACKEQCSGHGTYQTQTGGCVCEQGWSGEDCAIGELQSKYTQQQKCTSAYHLKLLSLQSFSSFGHAPFTLIFA